jgi:hypothetical protein
MVAAHAGDTPMNGRLIKPTRMNRNPMLKCDALIALLLSVITDQITIALPRHIYYSKGIRMLQAVGQA